MPLAPCLATAGEQTCFFVGRFQKTPRSHPESGVIFGVTVVWVLGHRVAVCGGVWVAVSHPVDSRRRMLLQGRDVMEIMIELTQAEIDAVGGGRGDASFSFTNTASGTIAVVSGTLTISTTASSASLSGSFFSSSS